jgi:hypothetical protein
MAGLSGFFHNAPGAVMQIATMVDDERCQFFLTLSDTHGKTTIPIDPSVPLGGTQGHTYRVEIRETLGWVCVDNLPAVRVPRSKSI